MRKLFFLQHKEFPSWLSVFFGKKKVFLTNNLSKEWLMGFNGNNLRLSIFDSILICCGKNELKLIWEKKLLCHTNKKLAVAKHNRQQKNQRISVIYNLFSFTSHLIFLIKMQFKNCKFSGVREYNEIVCEKFSQPINHIYLVIFSVSLVFYFWENFRFKNQDFLKSK